MEQSKTINSLSGIDSEITPNIRFINILDTDHEDTGIYQETSDNIPYLHGVGVKHLFLEIPISFNQAIAEFQEEYNKPHSDKESLERNFRNNFLDNIAVNCGDADESINSTIELITKATDYGIKVYAADSGKVSANLSDKYPEEFKMVQYPDEFVEKLKDMPLFGAISSGIKYLYVYTRFMIERLSIDKEIASIVKDSAQDENGNPERAAIIFGSLHSFRKEDIDEYLGKDKTLSVAIYRDAETKDAVINGANDIISIDSIDYPKYEIFLDSAKQLGKLDNSPNRQCYQR